MAESPKQTFFFFWKGNTKGNDTVDLNLFTNLDYWNEEIPLKALKMEVLKLMIGNLSTKVGENMWGTLKYLSFDSTNIIGYLQCFRPHAGHWAEVKVD